MITGSRRSTSPRHRPSVNRPYRAASTVSSTLSEIAVASRDGPPPPCAACCRASTRSMPHAWAERTILKEQKAGASHERHGKNASPPHERCLRERTDRRVRAGVRRQGRGASEEDDAPAAPRRPSGPTQVNRSTPCYAADFGARHTKMLPIP
jgi:hypothetical protein